MRARALVLAALLGGCSLYTPPSVPECTVKCGVGDICPLGSTCRDGYCAPPDSTKNCICTPGEQRECGGNGGKGECVAGLQKCKDEGVWGSCLGELRPSPELCDNRDNDCDGLVDEDVQGELCPNQKGVCSGARSACLAGQMSPCTPASYGADYQASESRCDSKDNDCDGLVDESPTFTIAEGVGLSGWRLLRTSTDYVVVQTANDAGTNVVVAQRFNDALQRTTAVTLGEGLGTGLTAAGNIDSVAAVWRAGTTVLGAVLLPTGPVTLDEVVDAEADGKPLSVAMRGATVVALFAARGQTVARVLIWNASTGALIARRDLNIALDNVPKATSFIDFGNLSDQGAFGAYQGRVALADGGYDTLCFLHDLRSDGGYLNVCGNSGVMLEAGPRLSLTATRVFNLFFPIPLPGLEPYSKVFYVDDLLATTLESLDVTKSGDPDQIGITHAYLAADGLPVIAYEDRKLGSLYLARVARLGSNLASRIRGVSTDGGFQRPYVTPGPGASLVTVSWWNSTTASAKLVCAP